jgi:PKD repeat protein
LIATNSANVIDYEWNWGDGTIEHQGASASHQYMKEGHYSVQLTAMTDKNCVNTIQKNNLLFVAPIPTMGFSIPEKQCLEIGSNSLSYVGSADDNDLFNWDLSSLKSNEIIQNPGNSKGPLVFDLKSQPQAAVGLQVMSRFGCTSEKKMVTLQRKPLFSLITPESQGCTPLTVSLKAKTGDEVDIVDYKWSFGDGNSGSGQELEHTYFIADQSYDLTLTASSATTGCKDSLKKSKFITVFPVPHALFAMDQKIFLNDNPIVNFTNESVGADRYLWNFGDGTSTDEKDPVHQFIAVGKLQVLLEAINNFGCKDSLSDEVQIAMRKIYPPNAFSPNALNPIDREFKLFSSGMVTNGYHLKILSRWNDVVFECRNEIKGWDGRMTNGAMAQSGNYIWILEFIDFLGKAHRQTGTVMLIF